MPLMAEKFRDVPPSTRYEASVQGAPAKTDQRNPVVQLFAETTDGLAYERHLERRIGNAQALHSLQRADRVPNLRPAVRQRDLDAHGREPG